MDSILYMIKLARRYWGAIIFSFVLVLIASVLTLATPLLISRLLALIGSGVGFDMTAVVTFSVTLAATFVLRAVCKFLSFYISHICAWRFVPWLTDHIYAKLQRLSMRFYHNRQTGELMSRAVNDARQMEVLFAHSLPDLMSSIVITVLVTVVLFTINPRIAALTVVPIPLIVVSSRIFMKRVGPIINSNMRLLGDLNGALQDNLSGIKEIQAFCQEERELRKISEIDKKYSDGNIVWSMNTSLFTPFIELLTSLGTIFVIAGGGYLALRGEMTGAEIMGFVLYLSLYYQPIATLARLTEDIQTARAGARRVVEILDEFEEIVDKPDAVEMTQCDGSVEFDHVSFHYQHEQPILKDICFKAEPGQMIALVGPTGVGKTTLISLIERFYDPVEGRVIIGGRDIRDVTLKSLRGHISIILQDVFLFNGTVADNIAYGARDASGDDVKAAARVACADGFISELPDGYNTVIGERGVRLSGGQKQRLAIARAVLRDAPILIMDEATASVDVETEAEIQKAISTLVGNRTVFVIAHRLSTVKRADSIFVIENGAIVERGTHEELVSAGGLYERLCLIQLQASEDVLKALSRYTADANAGEITPDEQ
ncbi:MAG: ABC transporter ATP-binding protein/permease [Oscillospiraceae bacterium]|jgi:ATP-binding cassette subfamily B protein/subfamily B ATP-binding cassette protein MsbA|nr:ABC transporter ATP-binding protein/permease [Oscillospiraceae bacterium]